MAEVVRRQVTEKGEPKLAITDPEYTISIVGLVSSFCGQPLVGLILCAIALKQSKRGDRHNTYALIGMIISIVLLALSVLFFAAYFFVLFAVVSNGFHGMRY